MGASHALYNLSDLLAHTAADATQYSEADIRDAFVRTGASDNTILAEMTRLRAAWKRTSDKRE